MSKQRGKLVLSSAEKEQLRQLIRAQSTPQGLAQRARVVQLAAQGMGIRAIGMESLEVTHEKTNSPLRSRKLY
jgi:hypothetical protein